MEIAGEYAAPLFAIASGLAFVLMDGVVQLVELKGVQPGEIMFIRQAITTFAVLAYILLTDPTSLHCLYPSASKSRLIWFRGVVNAAGGCENYLAVSHVAISEMITIEHFQPFFVGAMCWVWLGEKVSRRQGAACAVILIVRPGFLGFSQLNMIGLGARDVSVGLEKNRPLGFLMAALNMMQSAGDCLLVRMIGKEASPVVMLFAYALTTWVIAPTWMVLSGSEWLWGMSVETWLQIVALTGMGICAQIFLVMALNRTTGMRVAVLGYLQIPMSITVQFILSHTVPSLLAVVGMCVILAAGVWAAIEAKDGDESGTGEEVATGEYERVSDEEV